MITLAIELSSAQGSIALFRDDAFVDEAAWTQNRREGQALFREWPGLLKSHGLAPSEVGRYVCGRGPGTFSGLRVAIASAQSAALPTQAEVYALNSGAALAASIPDAASVAVIGDARRDQVWLGVFLRDPHGLLTLADDWQLVDPAQLADHAAAASVWVSPQWPRLQSILAADTLAHPAWIQEPRFPTARHLGQAALFRIAHGIPSEPATPIYLHPPVATS